MSTARIATIWLALCAAPAIAQLSIGRPGMTPVPPAPRKHAAPMRSSGPAGLTPYQQARLASLMQKMSGKQRKKLAKAFNHMTPEQRQQFTALLKQQLGEAPQVPRR